MLKLQQMEIFTNPNYIRDKLGGKALEPLTVAPLETTTVDNGHSTTPSTEPTVPPTENGTATVRQKRDAPVKGKDVIESATAAIVHDIARLQRDVLTPPGPPTDRTDSQTLRQIQEVLDHTVLDLINRTSQTGRSIDRLNHTLSSRVSEALAQAWDEHNQGQAKRLAKVLATVNEQDGIHRRPEPHRRFPPGGIG